MDQDDDHTSFPSEWTLPELPKGGEHTLLSTQFEDIFCGGDVDTVPLIELADDEDINKRLVQEEEVGSADPTGTTEPQLILEITPGGFDSVQDNNNQVLVSDKAVSSTIIKEEGETVNPLAALDDELVDTTSNRKEEEEEEEEEEEGEGVFEGVTTFRRSKRMRSRTSEQNEVPLPVKKPKNSSTIPEEPSGTTDELKGKEDQTDEQYEPSDDNKDDDDEGVDSSSSSAAEEEEEEEEDSDDPDKVWCICKQPHNDRFMICCDRCGEWYHGDCVGISVAEGKRMERNGQDYLCINCNDSEVASKAEKAKSRSMRLSRREELRSKQINQLLEKRGQGSSSGNVKSSQPVKPVKQEKCTCGGPGCDRSAITSNIYCSEGCIKKHIEFSLKKLSILGLSHETGSLGKGSGGITVVDTRSRKILTGLAAPNEKSLLPWIKNHPTYKLYVPSTKVLPGSKKVSSSRKSQDEERRDDESVGGKFNTESVRSHAQKALQQVLHTRSQLVPEEERPTDEVILKLSKDIELKLYNLHNQETSQKYRVKCRSLLFNLKDTKNEGLFKKILCGELSTKQLVRMTPEQLASKELAEWREKTIKKELEMIQEVAKEELQMSSVVRKMTYKGEVEIERDTTVPLLDVKSHDEVSSTTNEPTGPAGNKNEPIYIPPADSVMFSLLNDTTSKHGTHVFDQNCSICTGNESTHQSIKQEKTSHNNDDDGGTVIKSPDSREGFDHIVTSPDSLSRPAVPLSSSLPPPLWSGNVSMHAMPTFSAVAYHVSGRAQGLNEIFPQTIQIVGRIAHAQVWDYIDKLKCSTTKEIVILRFERIEYEEREFIEMMEYLIHKHRYGVMQCSAYVKDMYIIPLLSNEPIPSQIMPFDGPGLPPTRQDMFLCVITRIKNVLIPTASTSSTPPKRIPSSHVHVPEPQEEHVTPGTDQKHKVEIGVDGATPPDTPTLPIKVSFYGESKDFDNKPQEAETKPVPPAGTSNSGSISQSGIQSILSTLSDEKLQELASAMSTIQPSQEGVASPGQDPPTSSESETNVKPVIGQRESKPTLDERLLAIQTNIKTNVVTTPTDHTHSNKGTEQGKGIEEKRSREVGGAEYQSGGVATSSERGSYSAVRSTSGHYSYTSYHDNVSPDQQYLHKYSRDSYQQEQPHNRQYQQEQPHSRGPYHGDRGYHDGQYEEYYNDWGYRGGRSNRRYSHHHHSGGGGGGQYDRRNSEGSSYHQRAHRWNNN